MAVRAEHAQVLHAMIGPDAVDVVDLDGEGLAPPFTEPTLVAPVAEHPRRQQTTLYGTAKAAALQDFVQGLRKRPGDDCTAPDGLRPGERGEPELLLASARSVSR